MTRPNIKGTLEGNKPARVAGGKGMARAKPWSRQLCGVTLRSWNGRAMLLGASWLDEYRKRGQYPGEPRAALLWCSRSHARAWVRNKMEWVRARPAGDVCREWRFTVVRVTETVRVVGDD